MDNKIVFAQGGLGNQLFQYSFYLDLINRDVNCDFDIGRVVYDCQHNGINLGQLLGINLDDFESTKIENLPFLINNSSFSKIVRKLFRIFNVRSFYDYFYDFDAATPYHSVNFRKRKFIGYFQFVESALYSKDLLEKMIYRTHQEKIIQYKCKYNGRLAVHVRRGDFLTSLSANHKVISSKRLSSIFNKYKNRNIVVFSDDIDWCIEKFGSYDFIEFHKGNSAIDDFLALSQCSSYILLGSSFSWWAAFLFSNLSTEIIVEPSNHILFQSSVELNKLKCKIELEIFK